MKTKNKDFVNQIIHNESKNAANQFTSSATFAGNNPGLSNKSNKDLLSDPAIFLRKWIGEVQI